MSRADAPVFFDSDAVEWQAHPLFPPIDIKDLQPGAAHPAGTFSLMRVRVAAGGRIDPHTHPVETETAYVLRGAARLLCQGVATELRAGGGVSIPPGLEHSLEADAEVELLAIHTPPLRWPRPPAPVATVLSDTDVVEPTLMNPADFSADRMYRYVLRREIGSSARRVVFIMLNPSSADEDRNDQTVRRCVGFARRWGFGALEVVNLFALVSTDPNGLSNVDDPVGPRNDAAIRSALQSAATVVLAWGDKGLRHRDRADAVIAMAREAGTPCCFGMTKEGAPRHPLRLKNKAALTPF